jgi:hypothetical protein
MAAVSLGNNAGAGAELAPDSEVGEFLVKPGFDRRVAVNGIRGIGGIGAIGAEALCRVFVYRAIVFEASHCFAFTIRDHKIAGL